MWGSGEGLNVVRVVTKSVIERSILLEESIALSVLDGSEGALSMSQASSSCATFSISAWI